MRNNYNRIAKYYDFISRIVYGNSIVEAQKWLLKFVTEKSSVLIVGGGTGWILEELSKLYSENLEIFYVEISSKMIELAQKKNCKKNRVFFINEPAEELFQKKKFDVIITPFFFDNFLEEKIEIIFSKLSEMLMQKGLWLFTDFVDKKNQSPLWQKFLLKIMYVFFKVATNIEANELIDMQIFFAENYKKIDEKFFYSDFIKSVVYKKNY